MSDSPDNSALASSLSALYDEANTDAPIPPAAPEILAEWDTRWQGLWSARLSEGLEAAGTLYAPDDEETAPGDVTEQVALQFWRTVTAMHPHLPATAQDRYAAVTRALWMTLREIRLAPVGPETAWLLMVALRPVRKLRAGALTPEICAALYYYHRGVWTPYLLKPQMWIIKVALQKTLAALPPDEMESFWTNLHNPNPMIREAMQLGLELLRSAHAVPHLLRGLEQSDDHALRAAIVDSLEVIAEPDTLPTLARLRRETATTDWTLSRHIARVMRVIEVQTRDREQRTLLRPSRTPEDAQDSLLRPASDAARAQEDANLLRPTEAKERPAEKQPPG